jgi:hypothetical protein
LNYLFRRAKWRKQARLQLLQDAWRMRCLGMNSPPMVLSRQNIDSGEPSSPSSQPRSPANQNQSDKKLCDDNSAFTSTSTKTPFKKSSTFSNEGLESNNNNHNFQNYHQECNNIKSHPNSHPQDQNEDDGSESEEIDLTSTSNVLANGCIDYSTNNHSVQNKIQ